MNHFYIFEFNQTKNTMKKSNTQKRKLSKSELKEINGGALPPRCLRGFCMMPDSGEMVPGLVGKDGFCC
jgi:hypothetical protein